MPIRSKSCGPSQFYAWFPLDRNAIMKSYDSSISSLTAKRLMRIYWNIFYFHKPEPAWVRLRRVSSSREKFKFGQVFVTKVTMQCTEMKTRTEAYYLCKTTKTNHFFPNFSDLNTDAFFTFCQSVDKHLHFSHIEVTLFIKGNRSVGSSML